MSKPEDFFIGWQGDVSSNQKRWIKRLLIPIFIAIPIVIFAIVVFTKPFGQGIFELGKVKEFTGVYHAKPFPVLLLDEGQLPAEINGAAMLVGFGKSGARTWMDEIEKDMGSLSGKRIKIQGTLIQGDGHALIELTKKKASVQEVLSEDMYEPPVPQLSLQSLKGEIVDPKCWFGVMKPAEGKVHKSCAIRCISGGIPPVFKVSDGSTNTYYILRGKNGEYINQDVLEFVGESIALNGQSYAANGWRILRVDPSSIQYLND